MECGGQAPFRLLATSYTPSPSFSWCGAVVFFVLLGLLVWWLASSPQKPSGCAVADRGSGEPLLGAALRETKPAACGDPQPQPPHVDAAPLQPTTPLDVKGHPMVASVGGLNMQGSGTRGTTLQGAFDMTEAGKEFMQAYNPTGLASVMPAGWRTAKPSCQSNGDDNYAEWSRYSLSPQAVARSENMKSVLRLSENTRQGLSRTLGQQSLLRNAVTPIGPQPIGSNAFIFQDSSQRQAYIAAATGSFPSVSDMC